MKRAEQEEMSVFEAILARRSVRSYKDRAVGKAVLDTLMEGAVWAPTAMHREPWGFVIVQDKELLLRLSDRAKPIFIEEARQAGYAADAFAKPDFNVFYDAGTLIVICARLDNNFAAADCWMAAENLMLTACAMGLATCVIGASLSALNLAETRTELGIPAGFSAVAPIIVGYPRGKAAQVSRKKPLVLSRY